MSTTTMLKEMNTRLTDETLVVEKCVSGVNAPVLLNQ